MELAALQLENIAGAVAHLFAVHDQRDLPVDDQRSGLERMTVAVEHSQGFAFHEHDLSESATAELLSEFLDTRLFHLTPSLRVILLSADLLATGNTSALGEPTCRP
jgi:hypothetical protein